jgi:hypothetical protein
MFALNLRFPSSQNLAHTSVCAQPHILFANTRNYKCSPSASYFSPLRYSQLPVFAISCIFPSCQTLAYTSVRAQPHIPPLRLLAINTVHAQPHILFLSYTCNYHCSLSASYSLLRPWQMLVFALSLIFPSSQILATTSVCAQPPIPLLSDTCKYKCWRSASYSPPYRYSQLPMFSISLIFASCQILADTSVRAQPHIPLLSERRKCKCWRSASYSSHILANTSVRTQPHIPLLSVRYSQIPVFALSLIFLSSQILANTSVRTLAHIPFSQIIANTYQCSWLASSSPPLSYPQIPMFALSLILPSSQILANTIVLSQAHLPLLSNSRKYQCSRSASPPLRYLQIPVFALSLIFLSSQILATTSVRYQLHIPLLSDTRIY